MKKDVINVAENKEISLLKNQITALTNQVNLLTEQNKMLTQRLFGRKSEQKFDFDDNQLTFFDEAENEADSSLPEPEFQEVTYKRKKSKGKRELNFSGLPVETLLHELPEDERICPDCGGSLHLCGRDILRRELVIIPAQYKVREHMVEAYSCRHCEQTAEKTPFVKTLAPAPVIKGSGVASPSLVAHIANQKYTLALPLYRQEQEFKRNNLNLSRQTMANWLIYVSEHWLKPVYEELRKRLLKSHVIHADETRVQVLGEAGKTPESQSFMWLYRTGGDSKNPIILYEYLPNRKHENAKNFLSGFKCFLHSDGYGAYHNLPTGITTVGCWAHVRRKFADLLKSIPDYNKAGSIPAQGLAYCDALFNWEKKFAELSFDERYEKRKIHSAPIMEEFFAWAESSTGHILASPRSAIGKALRYALGQRKYLENVLLDGRLELSNNRAERSIKPFVIGRKNWLFSNTVKGAVASSIIYSIVETAKENGLKPYEYLKYIFETAPNIDITEPEQLEKLLPWNAPEECRSDLNS